MVAFYLLIYTELSSMRVAVFAAIVLALSCVSIVRAEDGADAAPPEGGAAAKEEGRGPRGEGRGPRGRFGRGEGGRGGAGREEMMKKFDKDGDGKLSEEERAELRKSFEGRRGGRGEGDSAEGRGPRGRFGRGGPGRGGPGREEMMKKFDTDGNGELSEEERTALHEEMKKRFEERGGEGGPEGGRRGPRGRRPPMPPPEE